MKLPRPRLFKPYDVAGMASLVAVGVFNLGYAWFHPSRRINAVVGLSNLIMATLLYFILRRNRRHERISEIHRAFQESP